MNNIQSEQSLENQLVEQLKGLEWDFVELKNESAMLDNLRKKLYEHNFKNLGDEEKR